MPYCQHCGAKLEDGQTCTCEMAQATVNQPSQSEKPEVQQPVSQPAPQTENQASTLFKKIKQYLSAYFANPAQATHSVMEAEYEPAVPIILAVIRLLSLGLALYGFLNKACKDALDLITKTLFRYYSSSAEILSEAIPIIAHVSDHWSADCCNLYVPVHSYAIRSCSYSARNYKFFNHF